MIAAPERSEQIPWKHLASVLRELTLSTSRKQVLSVLATAARQHCGADAIELRTGVGPELVQASSQIRSVEEALTSVTVAEEAATHAGRDSRMTVHWYTEHRVTAEEQNYLETVCHASLLALRALSEDATSRPATAYRPAERERFFDFQRKVRGLLAIVRSIVRRMAENPRSVEDFAAHLEGRLGALARIQGFLLRAPDAYVDLEELVRAEFLAQAISDEQLQISGPRVLLGTQEAGTLGLALHELATNSIKFGALAIPGGRIHVVWRRRGPDQSSATLDWREHVERAMPAITHRGFGFELIEQTLPYELGGSSSLVLHPSGLQCSITFILPVFDPPSDSRS
jgi:two-component sensor histidine kinase